MSKYISCADTAKLIRKELKANFPGIKFSVRSSSYSMGAHVSVSYIDGPRTKEVEAVCDQFSGSTFDGMIDLKSYHDSILNGEEVHYGADSVNVNHSHSPAFVEQVAKAYCAFTGVAMPKVEVSGESGYIGWSAGNRDLRDEIMPLVYDCAESELEGLTICISYGRLAIKRADTDEDLPLGCNPSAEVEEVEVREEGLAVPLQALLPELTADEQKEETNYYNSGVGYISAEDAGHIEERVEEVPSSTDAQFAAHDADPRSDTNASTIYRFDPVSRIHWLEFDGKPEQEVITLLKKEGWRWSGYRKQWHTNRRWTQVPDGIEYYNDGECDYSAERAERLEARAEKASHRGQASYQRAHQIMDMIPMGQPILVGHHSEKRARKDHERIDNGMRNWIQESEKARRLEDRAEGSIQHRAYLERPGVIHRRIQRLETDLRAFLRHRDRWENDLTEYEHRVSLLHQEIEENKQRLEESGGIKADKVLVEAGDIILIDGFIGRVEGKPRPNGKTYRVTITEGGAKGMELTVDRSRFSRIVEKHTL